MPQETSNSAVAAATKSDSPLPRPHSWSFTYHGPIAAKDDRECVLCTAVSLKKCPKSPAAHGSNPAGCAACHAAKIGHCANHAGLEAALAQHTDEHEIHKDHAATYTAACEAILNYAASLPPDVKAIYVKAVADQDIPDAPFAKIMIEVVATK